MVLEQDRPFSSWPKRGALVTRIATGLGSLAKIVTALMRVIASDVRAPILATIRPVRARRC